jgi:hypothetical protein
VQQLAPQAVPLAQQRWFPPLPGVTQAPAQQSGPLSQTPPSATQPPWQTPPTQTPLQQSPSAAHAPVAPCLQELSGQTARVQPAPQVPGGQAHVPAPEQVCPDGQAPASGPQFTTAPQLLTAVPHSRPAQARPLSVQPQTPAVPPPPQVSGGMHSPQAIVPPQPSGAVSHSTPAGQALRGTHGAGVVVVVASAISSPGPHVPGGRQRLLPLL